MTGPTTGTPVQMSERGRTVGLAESTRRVLTGRSVASASAFPAHAVGLQGCAFHTDLPLTGPDTISLVWQFSVPTTKFGHTFPVMGIRWTASTIVGLVRGIRAEINPNGYASIALGFEDQGIVSP